jgi:metal-responsive CopG/Arc/MetJ family transcriptional regulator
MPKPANAMNLVTVSLNEGMRERVKAAMEEDRIDRSKLVRKALELYLNARPGLKAGHMIGIAARNDRIVHTEIVVAEIC